MSLEDKIEAIIAPSVNDAGFDIIQIRMIESSKSRTLQIMAERRDGKEMSVDDCADISRSVSALLDVEDPITSEYRLEISSPGIDRPLVKQDDYIRFNGYEAKIETTLPMNGRKRFKGKIAGIKSDVVTIDGSDGSFDIPLGTINHAKLVLTDDLIREHLRRSKAEVKEVKESKKKQTN